MRDGKKYRIINLILDTDDNPTTWTDEEYKSITDNEVVIGDFMKQDGEQMKMNIYLNFLPRYLAVFLSSGAGWYFHWEMCTSCLFLLKLYFSLNDFLSF